MIPAGRSLISYQATVIAPDAVEDVDEEVPELTPDQLPDEALIYTLPSRFCLPDVLGAEAWSRFGSSPPGYRRVQAICDYVHDHVRFEYGTSTAVTTAEDVHTSGYGVCRDFTHLAVSFCRALNIPARYVFGYLPEIEVTPRDLPMDFAAWFEAYLDGEWRTFDARNNTPRIGRILMARGRDATDVAQLLPAAGPDRGVLDAQARDLAEREGVDVRLYRVIYDAIDDNRQYLATSPLAQPSIPLDRTSGFRVYGTWIFWQFLTEYFGGSAPDASIVRAVETVATPWWRPSRRAPS
jgi:transglutaminase-like putative cysteine protease